MGKLSNISLKTFRDYLTYKGLKIIRTKGGHEIWAGKQLNRPITLQTHISPIPEFIIKQCFRALAVTSKDFEEFLNNN